MLSCCEFGKNKKFRWMKILKDSKRSLSVSSFSHLFVEFGGVVVTSPASTVTSSVLPSSLDAIG